MKRITSQQREDAAEYMQQWVQSEKWDDLAVMLMEGDDELASHHLVNAGAIDSKNLERAGSMYEDALDAERTIEALAKRFARLSQKKQLKRYDVVFKGCLVVSCDNCNAVSFVHSGNETLYPEVKERCWDCQSENIRVKRWGDKK